MSPFHPTSRICFAMASTVGGQRRILKRTGTVIEYIRKAVESGTYRTTEEMDLIIKQRKDGVEDLLIIMTRLRQDIVRGSYIQDYPTEYLILEQHPPILDPPNTPKKLLRRLRPPKNPIHTLTNKYMKHYERYTSSSTISQMYRKEHTDPITGGPSTSEEYYRRILGVQEAAKVGSSHNNHRSSSSSPLVALYQKPIAVQRAYAAATLHFELQQQKKQEQRERERNGEVDYGRSATTASSSDSNSDYISMKAVDKMLSEQVSYEQAIARERRTTIVRQSQQQRRQQQQQSSTSLNEEEGTKSSKSSSLAETLIRDKKKRDRQAQKEMDIVRMKQIHPTYTPAAATPKSSSKIELSPTSVEKRSANDPFPFAKLGIVDRTTTQPIAAAAAAAESSSLFGDEGKIGNDGAALVSNIDDNTDNGDGKTVKADTVDDDDDDENPSPTMNSIFYSDPNTIEGMMRWSERLNAVPYPEWTVGASTALDHWIARQVLQLSELTWQSTLEGGSDNNDTDPTTGTPHLSIGRDIVACREAIFPETMIYPNRFQQEMDDERMEKLQSKMDALASAQDKVSSGTGGINDDPNEMGIETTPDKMETATIEDLLQRLGGLRPPDAAEKPLLPSMPSSDGGGGGGGMDQGSGTDIDMKMNQLVLELNNWRRRNVEVPYDQWESIDKTRFTTWMKQKYIPTVSSEAEKLQYRRSGGNHMTAVDYDETRIALLADPPMTEDESNEFWDSLHDETMVETLLDRMNEDGPPVGASILHESFYELPRPLQVRQLLNLGAIRPLLDEYFKETDRLRFLQRYGDIIATGVPMEHLVPDPSGPIKASDLSRDIVTAFRITDSERFRLETIPFRGFTTPLNDEDDDDDKSDTDQGRKSFRDFTTSGGEFDSDQERAFEKSQLLFKAWKEHKAGQKVFEKSRLLFKAWNEHKAGRARYEEKMFQSGRLGLRYSDENDINGNRGGKKQKSRIDEIQDVLDSISQEERTKKNKYHDDDDDDDEEE